MFNFELKKFIGVKPDLKSRLGESIENDIAVLLYECKRSLKKYDEEKIKKAFHIAVDIHKDKLRKSGEPQYTHSLAIALILLKELPLDETSVISSLLHDVMDNQDIFTIEDIHSEFGQEVADIVNGVSKIENIEITHNRKFEQIDNYCRLILSLFNDTRIMLVKIADRLHNMRTIEFLKPENQVRMSRETLEVYVPIANRLGLRNAKWELEDLAFKVLHRDEYDKLREAIAATRREREEYISKFIEPIEKKLKSDEFLKRNKVKYKISGRPKHIYSIYNKMRLQDKPIEELYDLLAVRVIIESDDPFMCFYLYGIIAGLYKPVPTTFKDYISSPKSNGYRSIHTALVGQENRIVELQIRTRQMHDMAENGVAAHFKYKTFNTPQSMLEDTYIQNWLQSVKEVIDNIGNGNSEVLLDEVKRKIFSDSLYVLTPNNEYRNLPVDSTPLDYAFDIHTDLGFSYVGAKVNGKIVPINYKLKNGDKVEILTSKHQKPSEDWMKYVVTTKAKTTIYKYIKDEEERIVQLGKEIWDSKTKQYGIKLNSFQFGNLLKELNFESETDLYYALSKSTLDISKAFQFIRYKLSENQNGGVNLHNPTKNGNNEIHKKTDNNYHFKLTAEDRSNLISELMTSFSSYDDLTLNEFSYNLIDNIITADINIQINSGEHLKELIGKIESISGVYKLENV